MQSRYRTVRRVPRGRRARVAVGTLALATMASLTLAGAAWAQEAGPAAGPVVGAAALPRDLSPWGMFTSADVIVKGVIIGLAFASVVTWTVFLAKAIELVIAKRSARRALAVLASAGSFADACRAVAKGTAADFLAAANAELRASADALDK